MFQIFYYNFNLINNIIIFNIQQISIQGRTCSVVRRTKLLIQLNLAEFQLKRQTGRQANQCTFKRSFYEAILTNTTLKCTLVCLSAC